MRRLLCVLSALVLLTTATVASATAIIDYEYTDAPTVMTQDIQIT